MQYALLPCHFLESGAERPAQVVSRDEYCAGTSSTRAGPMRVKCNRLSHHVRAVCAVQCASNPCQNAGTCTDSSNGPSIDPDAYKCKCVYPWQGPTCSAQNDPCVGSPCQNGGTCTAADATIGSKYATFKCTCTGGFEGKACDTEAPPPPTGCKDFDDISHATLKVRSALSSRLSPLPLLLPTP
jgi:hypothetical protein